MLQRRCAVERDYARAQLNQLTPAILQTAQMSSLAWGLKKASTLIKPLAFFLASKAFHNRGRILKVAGILTVGYTAWQFLNRSDNT